ncbi:MAG: conjugal transfer protein TraI [Cyclobacteriaceae bacterium]
MKPIKKALLIVLLTAVCITATPLKQQELQAGIPIAMIIKEGVKKVIKAVDLMIQRLQNKVIWLQNAQKVLENKLSQLKLTGIAEWTRKHRDLYKKYYDELWKVKNTLTAYKRIREIMDRQVRIVEQYKRAWNMVKQDKHFTGAEIDYMYRVYKGILNDSVRNLDQILMVINSFRTQMTDAERLAIIMRAGARIEQNFLDLLEFNMKTGQLSLNRAKGQYEIERVRRLYGL